MPESRPNINSESSLEAARRSLYSLVRLAMRQSTWTPWQQYGGPGRDCTRSAHLTREMPVEYFYIAGPRYDDYSWPGPQYTLDRKEGALSRNLTIRQRKVALYKKGWAEPRVTLGTLDITISNERTGQPEFANIRDLTEAEEAMLQTYGGAKNWISFDRSDIPEAQYRITETDDDLKVEQYGHFGRLVPDLNRLTDPAVSLVVVNGLLQNEIPGAQGTEI
jgi:hypothetical protein